MEGGMPTAICSLVEAQNAVGDNAFILSVCATKSEIESRYISYLNHDNEIEKYLISNNPDIIIFHGVYYYKYLSVSKIVASLRIPYCIEPHGAFVREAQNKSKIKKFVANRTLFARMIRNASSVIYLNSDEMEKSIIEFPRHIIVPNGCEVTELIYPKKQETSVFYIGRLDIHHKGLDILIKALDYVRNMVEVKVSIYGSGNKKSNRVMRTKTRNQINTQMCGSVYGEDKVKAFQENNIMILTSRYEGMPMTVLEALANGCPCIVTEGTNFSKIIIENGLGWCCDLNYKDIARVLLTAINEYNRDKDGYIQRTRDYIRKFCSWKQIAQCAHEEYGKVLEDKCE